MKKISYELLDLMDQYGTDRAGLARILEDCAEQKRRQAAREEARHQAEAGAANQKDNQGEAGAANQKDNQGEAGTANQKENQAEAGTANQKQNQAEAGTTTAESGSAATANSVTANSNTASFVTASRPEKGGPDDTNLADLGAELLAALSPLRENLLDWMDFDQNETVLLYGADYGAYVGLLQSKAGHVTVLDSADENLAVARRRWEQEPGADHVEYLSGTLEQLKGQNRSFSVVIAILPETLEASLESFQKRKVTKEEEKTYERRLFQTLKALTAAGGRLITAVPNTGALRLMSGAEPDPDLIALSRQELAELLEAPGAEPQTADQAPGAEPQTADQAPGAESQTAFLASGPELQHAAHAALTLYYPLPDLRFPSAIYSDAYLPAKGELPPIYAEYEKPRYRLFSEEAAYHLLCESGAFPQFANSYLAVWEKS